MKSKRDFAKDHEWEREQAHSDWWATTMREAFPNADDWRHARPPEQKKGVDFIVWGPWPGGRWIHNIDAKFRRLIWSDILIEVQSNSRTGSLGWAVKRSDTDYLAYSWVPNRETWFIPFGRLQWALERSDWVSDYGEVLSENKAHFGDYTTTNLVVPKWVVWSDVPNCFKVRLGYP